ncbi:hypothetical protein KQI49_14005 [Virgibacillus sp. MSJ-26]|uniref:hypothetical protein n=1 Tax=Virgibacillus sp. MSJ-26 TaxID=2841522 RepID=UPI001C0F911B|nr:hypothetical protein [Virgibacillus sp. MSJ-26]MBU5467940.1 hypothetical protein [Virgibacillus sp. MSJ-26]
MRIVNIGLILQLLYVSFYLFQIRTIVLQRFGIYAVAYIELALTIGSLLLGITALILRIWSKRTISAKTL